MIFQTGNCEVYYEFSGSVEGDPLLFLHGALGSLEEFAQLRNAFQNRSCLFVDFPSHGRSTQIATAPTTSVLAHLSLDLLQHLGIGHVDIIGYSLGGYVALEMALHRPQIVASIISHAMKFFWTEEAIRASTNALDWEAISRNDRRRQRLESIHTIAGAEEAVKMSRELIESFRHQKLTLDDLKHLQSPLLLSVGDQDELLPLEEILQLYKGLGYESTSLAIHPATRHPIHLLDPDLFSTSAHQFWAANSVTTKHEHANRTR